MSSDQQEKISLKPLEDIYIDSNDVQSIRDFFEHFNISIPDYLESALTNFDESLRTSKDKENILKRQNGVRIELCRAMVESESEVFKNPLLDVVIKNSESLLFNATFDEQVEEHLKKD